MVANIPEIDNNHRYTVAETCKIMGIHRNTLKRYTDGLKINCVVRDVDGKKLYLGSEIKRVIATTI